jgi:hypothetical protein
MSTHIISIGRNPENDRLDTVSWEQFKAQLLRLVSKYSRRIHFQGEGMGRYLNDVEQSFTVIFEMSGEHPQSLTAALSRLANQYNQDTIAYTVGRTALVQRRPYAVVREG